MSLINVNGYGILKNPLVYSNFIEQSDTSAPPAPVVPTDFPGLLLWIDASNPLNTGILPANNSSLPTWVDKSGNSLNFNQPTLGNQPIFQTNIQNSLPGIHFVTSNNYFMDCDPVDITSTTTVFFVFKPTTFNTLSIMDISTVTTPEFGISSQGNDIICDVYDGFADRGRVIVDCAFNQANIGTYVYDTPGNFTQGSVGTTFILGDPEGVSCAGSIGRRLGGHPTAPVYFEGWIFEVFWYSRAMTNTDILKLITYLSNKWNIAV